MEVPVISAIILYYLNMKPTHGYEIQKFLQVSGTDQWAKIQSGSIYYALTKLEKEKYIQVLREERTGSRVRKIFEITKNGKEELHREMAEELDQLISPIGSMKFFTDPMLSTLSKDEITRIVSNHIGKLKEQKDYWEKWYHIKVDDTATELMKLTFQMTIENVKHQISWHQELLDHLEEYITSSKGTEQIIRSLDFGQLEVDDMVSEEEQKLQYTVKLKNEILKDPQNALVNLDKIIEELQNQMKKK
jgi:DNA-binding PadR family transcriptional regulator